MATVFTVGSGDFPRVFRRGQIRHFKEGASQTFIANEVVKLITTAGKGNKIQKATATDADGTRVGIALEPASGVEDTLIACLVFDESVEILVCCEASGTLDANKIGLEYGIVFDGTNNIWRLDQTNTTQKIFHVIGFGPRADGLGDYGHGDTNGKYLVRVAVGKAALLAS
jgi:hypothetical protein